MGWQTLAKSACGVLALGPQARGHDAIASLAGIIVFVAMAGWVRDGIQARIQRALTDKFGAEAPAIRNVGNQETVAIVYAHLQQRLRFPQQFVRPTALPLKFRGATGEQDVQFFGAPPHLAARYATQLNVLRLAGERDVVVELKTKTEDESVILAMLDRPATLRAAIEQVRPHFQPEAKRDHQLLLSEGDQVVIPVMQFRMERNFSAICQRPLLNEGFKEYVLQEVYQDVDFRLDEAGAEVKSTAAIAVGFGGPPPGPSPRAPLRIAFDKPFLALLWKADAKLPYLVIWVASADVLLPFAKPGASATPFVP
jgi:hypothetical protein